MEILYIFRLLFKVSFSVYVATKKDEKKILGGECFWKLYLGNNRLTEVSAGQIHLEHASKESNHKSQKTT